MAMTYQERIAMETKVRAMLTSGMTTAQMADELGISQQAAHRFITRRGWQTMQVVSDADLHEQIDAMVAIARAAHGAPDRHAQIVDGLTRLYTVRAHDHGVEDAPARVAAVLGGDIEINAMGLEVWLDRAAR